MNQSVLIIGGGIAGIRAALDSADMGLDVYLVEKNPSLGGRMIQIAKTFPLDECSTCLLCHKGLSIHDRSILPSVGELSAIGRRPNIHIFTLAEVTGLEGEAGNFTVTVKKYPRYVSSELCTGCGVCERKCPVEVGNEFDLGFTKRKAIYRWFLSPQGVPTPFLIDDTSCLHSKEGCRLCADSCPAQAIKFDEQPVSIQVHAGALIVATGLDPYDPSAMSNYGYRLYKNVITNLEHERLLSLNDLANQPLTRPSDGKVVRRLGYILCVGSRTVRQNSFCSSICCMASVEEAMLASHLNPGLITQIFHTGFRAIGKEFEKCRARGERLYGINYIRSRVTKITQDRKGNPVVWYENTESREINQLAFDLVVLAPALLPSKGTKRLAEILGIKTDRYAFIDTDPIYPMETTRAGIYACGFCRGPADIPDSIAQASAAAARAAEFLEVRLAR